MRNFFLMMFGVLLSISANSQPVCSMNPLRFKSISSFKAEMAKLNASFLENPKSSECEPKTSGFLVVGAPLCLLNGSFPVDFIAYVFATDSATPLAAIYFIDYSKDTHDKLRVLLAEFAEQVSAADLPDKLRTPPVHEEFTVTVKKDDFFVTLQKPSDGMPGQWSSFIFFERKDSIGITRRDLNTCK